jgi:hypothetical protein
MTVSAKCNYCKLDYVQSLEDIFFPNFIEPSCCLNCLKYLLKKGYSTKESEQIENTLVLNDDSTSEHTLVS